MFLPNPGILAAGAETDRYLGADIVLDFAGVKNGGVPFYRVDGVTYASAAAAGFIGSGTFNANGYTAGVGQKITRAGVALPGDCMVHSRFVNPGSGVRTLFQAGPSGTYQVLKDSAGYDTTPVATLRPTTATSVSYGRAGGLAKVSFDGAPVTTTYPFPIIGTGDFHIGNDAPLSFRWGTAIQMLTIHNRTLSDDEIMGLSL